jgi:branched-chain amino acid transport system permease protein
VILQILISGLLLGGMYSLIASGFSLINGVMKIFNFGHGALVMLGAYITYWATVLLGINPLLTIPVSMGIMFVLGYVIQRGMINFIVRAPLFMTLILTYGLDMLFVNLALLMWTGNVRTTPVPYAGRSLQFFGASIPLIRLLAFFVALVVTLGLHLLMRKTRFGRAINAARMDIDAAKLVGVKISGTYALTFALGSLLAGVAGSLLSLVGPITPSMGTLYSAKAFAICILGGSGSMLGPLAGGLLMGFFETAGVAVFGAGYQEVVSFMVLLLVLIVRPHGIFGKDYY